MKKKYYRIDNGDSPVINPDLKVIMELLESEASDYKTEPEDPAHSPEWMIDFVWLTDEEYENLLDA
jgi:hypothetical protein